MLKKLFRGAVSAFLAMAIAVTTCTNAMAASSKATYIKDVVISYGNTEEEAKNWLTENGYQVLDNNLNEGADDFWSDKRAVYLGYTTTTDAEEAITDMRLMNMKGGYSVQDYQILLEEQKANVRAFLDQFIVVVNEYRENYANGQQRAIVAHELLNLLYDDDTQQYMGDLLLNKVKEEYSDEEWDALSGDVQAKIADMTTILMQANAKAVLAIQQIIAMATDDDDSTWVERYTSAKTYDEMLDELMDSDNLTINEAEKQLAAEYDEDAKAIAAKCEGYKTFLETYSNILDELSLVSTQEEIEAYQAAHEDFNYTAWAAAAAQYELLYTITNDGVSLLDLLTSDDYDVENEDRYMLYPLVSVLTEGQRACIDMQTMSQIVAFGINGDDAMKEGMTKVDLSAFKEQNNSIYDGVDRTIFSDEVALTNEAIRLQASSGQSAVKSMGDYLSLTSFILYGVTAVSAVCSITAIVTNLHFSNLVAESNHTVTLATNGAQRKIASFLNRVNIERMNGNVLGLPENTSRRLLEAKKALSEASNIGSGKFDYEAYKAAREAYKKALKDAGSEASGFLNESSSAVTQAAKWQRFTYIAGAAMVAVTVVLMAVSLWQTIQDLQEYYNAEFTPIPLHMVDESVDEYDAKVYTYYDAVTCNREEMGMVTDATKLIKYGDLNGDVGRQWVALYTTKDKAAGNPITELKVQYENSNLPDETYTALSMFGENSAQNLTNKTSGYTYANGKSGIYLFYKTDANAFAGSVFSNNSQILVSVTAAVAVGVAAFFVGMGVEKKRKKGSAVNA